jgi:predicted transcriptional regulator
MPRPAADSLTPREAEIMSCLWRLRAATAEQIRDELSGQPHDSSVRTLLRVLEQKGYVRHRVVGKAFEYLPLIERAPVESKAVLGLLKRYFSGSAHNLVLRLLEDERISPEELDRLAALASQKPASQKPWPPKIPAKKLSSQKSSSRPTSRRKRT